MANFAGLLRGGARSCQNAKGIEFALRRKFQGSHRGTRNLVYHAPPECAGLVWHDAGAAGVWLQDPAYNGFLPVLVGVAPLRPVAPSK